MFSLYQITLINPRRKIAPYCTRDAVCLRLCGCEDRGEGRAYGVSDPRAGAVVFCEEDVVSALVAWVPD